MSVVLSVLSIKVLHLVVNCHTSHNICTTPEIAFAYHSNSRIIRLYSAFQDFRQDDDTVSVYLQKAKTLFVTTLIFLHFFRNILEIFR
jgi:hypothetical protein